MEKTFLALGALSAAVGVALGAFGAHSLRNLVPEASVSVFETGVRYHVYHALGLLAVAWAATRFGGSLVYLSGWLFVTGILLFSGSLYLLVITGQRWLALVTPLGGVAFILGWLMLAWAVVRS